MFVDVGNHEQCFHRQFLKLILGLMLNEFVCKIYNFYFNTLFKFTLNHDYINRYIL